MSSLLDYVTNVITYVTNVVSGDYAPAYAGMPNNIGYGAEEGGLTDLLNGFYVLMSDSRDKSKKKKKEQQKRKEQIKITKGTRKSKSHLVIINGEVKGVRKKRNGGRKK